MVSVLGDIDSDDQVAVQSANLATEVDKLFEAVNEVSQQNDRQCRSYHGAPSFRLSSYIDSHVTSQVLVIILTTKVVYSGVNVSFIIIFKVILSFIFGHDITSLVDRFVIDILSCLVKKYGRIGNGQCEPVVGLVVVENYQCPEIVCPAGSDHLKPL